VKIVNQLTGRAGRTSARRRKQSLILTQLRARIASGHYGPGERLPTIRQLVDDFGVSYVTAQRAMAQLVEEGFILNNRQNGTFVAERPPNRSRFAIVFPHRPVAHRPWSMYWAAMERAALELEGELGVEFPIRYDIEAGAHRTEDFEQLVNEVETDQLAGLIFAHSPHNLIGTPVLDHPGVPRVAVMTCPMIEGVRAVSQCEDSWLERAMDQVKQVGRKRVAVLLAQGDSAPNGASQVFEKLEAMAAQRGLTIYPHWIQSTSPLTPTWASHAIQAIFQGNAKSMPDALLITDDNLAADAQRGLVAAGVVGGSGGSGGSGGQVYVITLCNWPSPPSQVIPMWRLGLDARQMLDACMSVIQTEREGRSVEPLTLLPLVDEDQFRELEKSALADANENRRRRTSSRSVATGV